MENDSSESSGPQPSFSVKSPVKRKQTQTIIKLKEERRRQKTVRKALNVLRQDCYQDLMKPYFKVGGNTAKDFSKTWLNEDRDEKPRIKKTEISLFQKYILVKPNQKYYIASRVFFFCVYLLSFVLTPFFVMVQNKKKEAPNFILIIFIDLMWIVHIVQRFQFAY